jgi:hypothetical protein
MGAQTRQQADEARRGRYKREMMHDLATIVSALHDSEINGEVSWLFDGVWTVKIGDPMNGYVAVTVVASPVQAAEWFRDNALRLYPRASSPSDFRASCNKRKAPASAGLMRSRAGGQPIKQLAPPKY